LSVTDPATASAQTIAVSITAFTVALIGVPHIALVWGFVGAAATLALTAPEARSSTLLSVFVSGLIGAVSGTAAAEFFHWGAGLLGLAAAITGAGAKPLLSAAIARLAVVISTWGAKS
jgi:hypothetical protein